MEEFESTNINLKWLENIYEQLKSLQNLERMATEGCSSLSEYLEIPPHLQGIIIPKTRYKNMRFIALELKMLINNLVPILEGKEKTYKERLDKIIENIDDEKLYLEYGKQNNQNYIKVKNFLILTVKLLIEIKSEIIGDMGHLLYIKEGGKPKW